MATIEAERRSTRVRNPVRRLIDESTADLEPIRSAKRQRTSSEDSDDTRRDHDADTDERSTFIKTEDQDDGPLNDSFVGLITTRGHLPESHAKIKSEHGEDEPVVLPGDATASTASVQTGKPSKRTKGTNAKAAKKKKKDSDTQLYGYPPEGTIIPWGITKTRKQPKIYELAAKHDKPAGWWHSIAAEKRIVRARESIAKLAPGQEEFRLKSYEDVMPEWYERFLESASTQKMFVLDRQRGFEADCHAHHANCPEEILTVAGSKGKVYTVTISHLTSCTCPVGVFDKIGEERQCKHVLYVLHHVFKLPEHLRYQAAFLTAELKEMFANAPLPGDLIKAEELDKTRKPIDGDCPICFMEFGADDDVVWCKAACGNNIHHDCFQAWASTKANPTCPFCRTPWLKTGHKNEKVTISRVEMPLQAGHGGYFDVRDQLAYD